MVIIDELNIHTAYINNILLYIKNTERYFVTSRPFAPGRYDLIIFEGFTHKGQKRQRAWRCGSAVASTKGDMVLYIPAGVSITGRVLVVPEKTPLTEMDVLDAYQSAADEHGV